MNFSVQCCLQSLKQNWRRIHILTHLNKYTKLSTSLSQVASRETNNNYKSIDMERAELVLLKNLLSIHHTPVDRTRKLPVIAMDSQLNYKLQRIVNNHHSGSCRSNSTDSKERLLIWEDILLNPRYIAGKKDKALKSNSKEPLVQVTAVRPKMWDYNIVHNCIDHTQKDCDNVKVDCLEFTTRNMLNKETQNNEFVERRTLPSGPSPEQLSLVLLRLREELPHFFEGHHRYSIYSEDILFVNKLTRTTTRSLKAYKFFMKSMQYVGRLFWNKVSLEIVRITKHPEDNTIKLRWTAKGILWYQLPFFVLTGKPQSTLFYRYVDGFSIFEVGRDGLIHCHRLDKVIPTSTPERQKWSLRMQILTLLGLAEIDEGACEAYQMKNEDILKKA